MKRLFTSFALAMLVMLGATGIAQAQFTCANAPGTVMGNVIIGDPATACTLGAVSDSNGSITVLGSTITITGTISAFSGVTVTGTGAVQTQNLMSSNGGVGVGGSTVTINTALSVFEAISISATSTVQTQALTTTAPGGAASISVSSSGGAVTTTGNVTGAGFVTYGSSNSFDTTITGSVMSGGYIVIQGQNIKVTQSVTATGGPVNGVNNGNIILVAQKNLSTGSISTTGSWNIDLKANLAGGITPFVIGSGGTNGVNGTISGHGTGSQPTVASTVVYVTNSTMNNTGDITISSATAITVPGNTGSDRAGYILLNANAGKISMPSGGTMSASGVGASAGAGVINFLAKEIDFGAAATLTASQTSTTGTLHGVALAATTVSMSGGLTIHADGNGNSATFAGFAQLLPIGAITITEPNGLNPLMLTIQVTFPNNTSIQAPITYSGTGKLTVTCNGNNDQTLVAAYPITFSAGAVTLQSTGKTNHTVTIVNPAPISGTMLGLAFDGSGTVILNANATSGGTGGAVSITVDQANFNKPTFTIEANGPPSGAGGGGTVFIQSSLLTLKASSKATVHADGAPAGNGSANPAAINIQSGTGAIKLGTNAGEFALSALGGMTGGSGGGITVFALANISVDTGAAAASAQTGNGDGGTISLTGNPNVTIVGTNVSISANGGSGTGNGGQIHILGQGAITVGTGANAVALSAIAPGSGTGGTIEIGFSANLTINTANLLVSSAGLGNGGTINLHDLGAISLTGNLVANGSGTGNGGSITISQTSFSTLTISTSMLIADSGPTSGSGGTVSVTSGDNLDITGSAISVTAAGNGNGGTIKGTATAGALTLTGNLSAEGVGSGNPGLIQLTGNTLSIGTAIIDASAGVNGSASAFTPNIVLTATSTSGLTLPTGSNVRAIGGGGAANSLSGTITVSSAGNVTVNGLIDVHNSASNGNAGRVNIIAGSNSTAGSTTVNGQILASALVSPGSGGVITFKYYDSVGSSPVTIASGGQVDADRPDTSSGTLGAGSLVIQNTANSSVGAFIEGLFSANNGFVIVITPSTPENVQLSGDGKIVGAIDVLGVSNNVIIDMGTGDVTIDQIANATTPATNVTINASAGNVLSDGVGNIYATTLAVQSSDSIGDVGTNGQALLTAVQNLTLTADTAATANVSVSNTNASGQNLTLATGAVASETFQLVTNNALTMGSVRAGQDSAGGTHLGNVSITASGNITIQANAAVYSYGGGVYVFTGSTAKIQVKKGAGIVAFGSTNQSFPGLVYLEVGTPVGLRDFTGSSCMDLTTGSLFPQVSVPGITTNCPPMSHATVLNSSMILYGPAATSITFQGGNQVTATNP